MNKSYAIPYEKFDTLGQLPENDRAVVEAAKQATTQAIAPYSHFNVGAAALLESGRIITGSNIESEVFPATMCAERSLLFYHQANHSDDKIVSLAIASNPSDNECYPCGQCRQVLVDVERRQESNIRVIMCGLDTASAVESAELLLPFTFKL